MSELLYRLTHDQLWDVFDEFCTPMYFGTPTYFGNESSAIFRIIKWSITQGQLEHLEARVREILDAQGTN